MTGGTGKAQADTGTNGQGAAAPVLKTVRQAAEYTGLSERTIRRHIKAGKLATVNMGGRELIQPDELQRLAATAGQTPAVPDRHAGHVSDPLMDALQDTIRRQEAEISRQESEISYLRTELTATRNTLDNFARILPAPAAKPSGKSWDWLFWILLGALAVIVAGLLYAVWRPPAPLWTSGAIGAAVMRIWARA